MLHFTDIADIRNYLNERQLEGKSVGLVPTMGALHDGHYSLVKAAVKENDIAIASIFINPVQFDQKEDFENYPKTMSSDFSGLEKMGTHIVFTPSLEEIYPSTLNLNLSFGSMEKGMEGKFREGHFNGVGIIVGKLLNIIRPNTAYFGQKDLQQFSIITCLVEDLSYDVELKCMPTVRSENGLALSSRNQRLSKKGLDEAALIYKSLNLAHDLLRKSYSIAEVEHQIHNLYEKSNLDLEYFAVVDAVSLVPLTTLAQKTALCVAAHVEGVRLIDNMIISE